MSGLIFGDIFHEFVSENSYSTEGAKTKVITVWGISLLRCGECYGETTQFVC